MNEFLNCTISLKNTSKDFKLNLNLLLLSNVMYVKKVFWKTIWKYNSKILKKIPEKLEKKKKRSEQFFKQRFHLDLRCWEKARAFWNLFRNIWQIESTDLRLDYWNKVIALYLIKIYKIICKLLFGD